MIKLQQGRHGANTALESRAPIVGSGDWRDRSACLNEDPDLFFPIGTTGPAVAQAAEARKVCADCPVRTQCLQWAVADGMEYGIWGGLDELERRSMTRGGATSGGLRTRPAKRFTVELRKQRARS